MIAPLPAIYSAPAGDRAAGPLDPRVPYAAILPNGRIIAPAGRSVALGTNALGVALTPDGQYAIVSDDDARRSDLTVIETATMRVTDAYSRSGVPFFVGVASLKNPSSPSQNLVLASGGPSDLVRIFTLDNAGRLHEERALQVPAAQDDRYASAGHAFPASIALSPDGRVAYVVNNVADTVTAIDIAARTILRSAPVGYFPYDVAVSGNRLFVTDSGLMNYARLATPAPAPAFTNVPAAPSSASALTAVSLTSGGDVGTPSAAVAMDEPPDGRENIGGAHPGAIAISKDGRYAYVCMANVDRLAVVDLLGPKVVGGIPLQLFDRAPFGTQPDAIVRSPDGRRLYVALAGIDAVAVLDARAPAHLHRLGLIPTGWYPSALAISANGRILYVANAKGDGVTSTLQRIDLHGYRLRDATLSSLRDQRTATRAVWNPIVPPLRSLQRSSVIRHVVFIADESATYDDVETAANVTPNLRTLVQNYAFAANSYADAQLPGPGRQFATAGIASVYTEKTAPIKGGANEDPEDYPRAGYIFNGADRAQLTYRDYGYLLNVSGYGPQTPPPAGGLGGLYALDVPAPGVLAGHVDLEYAGWNPGISDVRRAQEFVRDYGALEHRGTVPDVTYVSLPGDGTQSPQAAANGDRAVGTIIDFLSHQPSWSSTAIFITADHAASSANPSEPRRTYAILVSPYAKRRYVSSQHLSTVSIVKTEEELLGLPPLSLGDLLATDMTSFFTSVPDLSAFTAAR